MKLESLEISLNQSYQPNPGQYTGKVKFTNQNGVITVPLNEETSLKILQVVSGQIVATSREMALNLSSACIEHTTGKQIDVDKSEVVA